MKSKYKLLAIDIDGTLITDRDEVSPGNLEALRQANAAGVHVSLSTGRSLGTVRPYIDALSLGSNYHILFDGALVARDHEPAPVYIGNLAEDLLHEIIGYVEEHDMDIELASITGHYARRETWSSQAKKDFFGYDTIIRPLSDVCRQEKILRGDIVVRTSDENIRAEHFIKHFTGKAQFSEAYSPRYPGLRFINIIAPGLTKGTALQNLAIHLDIGLSEVMAVGDWLNDIPMLQIAGLGIAMGNAHDEVKNAADAVTVSVEEDGLAAAIREYLLQENPGK